MPRRLRIGVVRLMLSSGLVGIPTARLRRILLLQRVRNVVRSAPPQPQTLWGLRGDLFGDLDLARFAGEPRGGVAASATTGVTGKLLRGLLRTAAAADRDVVGIKNPECDHGGIPLDGQDGSCDDSVTSSKFQPSVESSSFDNLTWGMPRLFS